jgi:hypothetical protein
MFQIGAGGQLGDLITWELTPQKTAELFAKLQAAALESDFITRAAPQVDQR